MARGKAKGALVLGDQAVPVMTLIALMENLAVSCSVCAKVLSAVARGGLLAAHESRASRPWEYLKVSATRAEG